MRERSTYWTCVKFCAVRLLVLEALLLVWIYFVAIPVSWLLLDGGLLVAVFLVWLAIARPRATRFGGTGCLGMTFVLLISVTLGAVSFVLYLVGFPSVLLEQHAVALFFLVLVLGLPTHHWRILEECYCQVYLARKIERDLGFESDTNTLEGTFLAGRKYMFLNQVQPGGLMDLAGYRRLDIVLDDGTFTDFWQRLEDSRGGPTISIAVASWSDSGPVSKRPTRQLSVSLPRKHYSADLEKNLGFRCEVKFIKESDIWNGVVVVTGLKHDGLMKKAGFQDRDILLNAGNVPHLFEKFEKARGGAPLTIEVVPWLDPSDIADRPIRELILEVPAVVDGGAANQPCDSLCGADLERDLGFKQGWEWLPNRGKWHGWPTVEDLHSDGVLARAGFLNKDILLEGFGWHRRWAQGQRQAVDYS